MYELAKTHHMLGRNDDAFVHALDCFARTQQVTDPIMWGCAYRILGDLLVAQSVGVALALYSRAETWFKQGFDPKATTDLQDRREALLAGKDPKFVS